MGEQASSCPELVFEAEGIIFEEVGAVVGELLRYRRGRFALGLLQGLCTCYGIGTRLPVHVDNSQESRGNSLDDLLQGRALVQVPGPGGADLPSCWPACQPFRGLTAGSEGQRTQTDRRSIMPIF